MKNRGLRILQHILKELINTTIFCSFKGDGDLFVSSEIIARVQVVDRSLPALRILRIGQQPVVSRNSNSDSSLLSLPQIDHRVKLVTPLYTAAGTVLAQVQTSYDDRKLPTDSSVA